MELKETIELRRSIRHYIDKEISNDIINDLLNCARLAPSAMNRQPWFFIVLKKQKKDEIAKMMIEWCQKNSHDSKEQISYLSSVTYTANVIKDANCLILVFKDNNPEYNDYDNLSIGGCIENILLRATDLDIGSLWIGHTSVIKKEIEELYGNEIMELSCAVALGYTDIKPKARPRKELNEIVEYIE